MRVLVTGASGFIGGHVVEALLAEGHDPVAAVRPTSNHAALERLGVPLVYCDVEDRGSLVAACRDVDCVVHTAAIVATYGNWEPYRRIGVVGTENVVRAAVEAGVPRMLHVSSIAVYGLQRRPRLGRILREESPLAVEPEVWNHYVREKVLSEQIVWKAHERGEIRATTIRPSVVLGPRDRAFVTRMSRVISTPFRGLIGLGNNRVGCIAVTDLARLAVLAITRDEAIGRAYNASSSEVIDQKELVRSFSEAFGRRAMPWRVPFPVAMLSAAAMDELWATAGAREEPIFSRFSVAIIGTDFVVDCSRAERELGWRGETDLRDMIRQSVDWYVAHRD